MSEQLTIDYDWDIDEDKLYTYPNVNEDKLESEFETNTIEDESN